MSGGNELISWLNSRGVRVDRLKPFEFEDTGRGLKATCAIEVRGLKPFSLCRGTEARVAYGISLTDQYYTERRSDYSTPL